MMLVQSDNSGDRQPIHVLEMIGAAIVGGMETYVYNLIRKLPSPQFRVTCLCPHESQFTMMLRDLGCTVFIAPLRDEPPWRTIQMTVEILRHHHIDLIHAHLPNAHVVAGLAAALLRTPVVATIHGMNVTTHEFGISRTTGSHMMLVCQEAYMQALAMGMPPEQVTLIPNGIDLEHFKPHEDGPAVRSELGLPLDAPVIGYVARLSPEKGPDQFVRSAEVVLRAHPDTHFVMVGEGMLEGQVRDMLTKMNLTERVHLLGLRRDTQRLYSAFDIVAHTSRSEGMPLALLESMACGVPTVAIGVGGVPEIVEVGTTGLLAGPGDWEGVGFHLINLLQHPDLRKEMGQAARRRTEQFFDLDVTVRRTGDLFRRLAGSNDARARSVLRTSKSVSAAR